MFSHGAATTTTISGCKSQELGREWDLSAPLVSHVPTGKAVSHSPNAVRTKLLKLPSTSYAQRLVTRSVPAVRPSAFLLLHRVLQLHSECSARCPYRRWRQEHACLALLQSACRFRDNRRKAVTHSFMLTRTSLRRPRILNRLHGRIIGTSNTWECAEQNECRNKTKGDVLCGSVHEPISTGFILAFSQGLPPAINCEGTRITHVEMTGDVWSLVSVV